MCSLKWNRSPQIAFHYSQSESILFLSPQKSERTVAPRWRTLPQGFHTVSTHQDNHCVLERIRRRKKGEEFFRSHLSEDFKLSLWGRSVCFIATIPHRVDLLIFKGLLKWFYSESKKVAWKRLCLNAFSALVVIMLSNLILTVQHLCLKTFSWLTVKYLKTSCVWDFIWGINWPITICSKCPNIDRITTLDI